MSETELNSDPLVKWPKLSETEAGSCVWRARQLFRMQTIKGCIDRGQ